MPSPIGASSSVPTLHGSFTGPLIGSFMGSSVQTTPVERVEHARHRTSKGIVAVGRHIRETKEWIRK